MGGTSCQFKDGRADSESMDEAGGEEGRIETDENLSRALMGLDPRPEIRRNPRCETRGLLSANRTLEPGTGEASLGVAPLLDGGRDPPHACYLPWVFRRVY